MSSIIDAIEDNIKDQTDKAIREKVLIEMMGVGGYYELGNQRKESPAIGVARAFTLLADCLTTLLEKDNTNDLFNGHSIIGVENRCVND